VILRATSISRDKRRIQGWYVTLLRQRWGQNLELVLLYITVRLKMKWKVKTFYMCPFNIYKYNIPLLILLFSFSFSILELHKWNCRNSPELLSVKFISFVVLWWRFTNNVLANSFRIEANIFLKIAIHRTSKLSFCF
jgi:hypothetical protein